MQKLFSGSWFLLSLLFLWTLPLPSLAAAPKEIRIGVAAAGAGTPPRVVYGYLAIAQQQQLLEKEFEKDGIRIEWVFFKGAGPAVNEAFSNKQIDFAWQGDLPSIIGRSGGLDTRVLMASGKDHTYVIVQPNSQITRLQDLRGKRVGLHKGTNSQLSATRILAKAGLRERDVRIFNLDQLASLAAFQSGELDAMFVAINGFRLEDLNKGKIIYGTQEDPAFVRTVNFLVQQSFSQAYPDITQRVVSTLVKAAYWSSLPDNRLQVLQSWENGPVTVDYWERDLQGSALKPRVSPLLDEYSLSLFQAAVEDAIAFRLIRRAIDLDTWVDDRYLKKALEELDLQNYWPPLNAQGFPPTLANVTNE